MNDPAWLPPKGQRKIRYASNKEVIRHAKEILREFDGIFRLLKESEDRDKLKNHEQH